MAQSYVTPKSLVKRLIGTNDYIYIDMGEMLYIGETISGTPTLSLGNEAVTIVSGTLSVVNGGIVKVQLDHIASSMTRLDISFSTTVPNVTKSTFIMLQTNHPTSDGTVVTPLNSGQEGSFDARLDALEIVYINAKNYGIVGNGITDNLTAFNNLVSAIPATGALIEIPTGIYSVSSNINPITTPNVRIIGAGRGATVIQRTSVPTTGTSFGILSAISTSKFEVSGLTLKGTGAFGTLGQSYGKGVFGRNVADMYIHDVEAHHLDGEAIYADGDSPRVCFERNYAHDNPWAGININSSILNSSQCAVMDNISINNSAGLQVSCKSSIVSRNQISNPLLSGTDLVIMDGQNFIFTDNVIVDSRIDSASVGCIHVGQNSGGGAESGIIRGNIIRNNRTANDVTSAPIFIENITAGDIVIESNLITDNGDNPLHNSPAISLGGASLMARVIIRNNIIIKGALNKQGIGVRIEATVPVGNNITVEHNSIDSDVGTPYLFAVQPKVMTG